MHDSRDRAVTISVTANGFMVTPGINDNYSYTSESISVFETFEGMMKHLETALVRNDIQTVTTISKE